MPRKVYKRELPCLQTELAKLQEWGHAEGARLVVAFEVRDAAGKGGIIKRIAEPPWTNEAQCAQRDARQRGQPGTGGGVQGGAGEQLPSVLPTPQRV